MRPIDEYDVGGWRGLPLAFRPVSWTVSVILRMNEPTRFGRYEIVINWGLVYGYASLDYLEQGSDQYELVNVITTSGERVAALVKLPLVNPGRVVASTAVRRHVGGPLWEMEIRTHGGEVICKPCQGQAHGKCKGGNWCDCQHRDLGGKRPDGPVV